MAPRSGIQGQGDAIAAREHIAHLVGEEGQVEQAELDDAAALVAVRVQPHHEARARSQADLERVAGLHPAHDRAVDLERRPAAALRPGSTSAGTRAASRSSTITCLPCDRAQVVIRSTTGIGSLRGCRTSPSRPLSSTAPMRAWSQEPMLRG